MPAEDTITLFCDTVSQTLLTAADATSTAPPLRIFQGDIRRVEFFPLRLTGSFQSPTEAVAISPDATIRVAIGAPGSSTPAAIANLPEIVSNGRAGELSLSTAPVRALLGTKTSVPVDLEVEMVRPPATPGALPRVSTLLHVTATLVNDLIEDGGADPTELPTIAADVAALRRDVNALTGHVPLAPWTNSTVYPFSTFTTTAAGQPSVAEAVDGLGEAVLDLPAWRPSSVSVTGTLSKTNVGLATIRQVKADGTVVGSAIDLGTSVDVTMTVDPDATSLILYFSHGADTGTPARVEFSGWATSGYAALSELTAEALAEIEQHKTNASQWAYDALTSKGAANDSATYAASFEAAAEVSKNNALGSAQTAAEAEANAVAAALAAGNADKLAKGDPRANALGGVSLRGDTGTGSGLGCTSATPTLSSEFEIVACVRRTSSDATMRHLACIQTSAGAYNVVFGAATSGGTPMLGWGGNYEVTVPNPTAWHWISFGHDSLGWFFTLDGVLTRSASLPGQTPVAINRVFAGDSGVGQFGGDVARCWRFNFALSSAQRSALILNDQPSACVRQAQVVTSGLSFVEASDVNNRLTVSGSTFTKLAGPEPGSLGCYARSDGSKAIAISRNDIIRVNYSCAMVSGSAADLPALVFGDYNSLVVPISISTGNKAALFNVGSVDSPAGFSLSLNWGEAYTGKPNYAEAAFTFSISSVERLGAQGRWEPLNVTLLPRWLDSSGNGNDIIPVGKGVTPLNPLPPRSWSVRYTLNFNTQSPTATRTDGGGASPFSNITFADGFNALMWFDSWMPDSVRRTSQLRVFDIGGAAVPTRLYGNASPAYDYMKASSTPGGNTVGAEYTWKE